MFKLPHQEWLEKQPLHTQMWLKKQTIWSDKDMVIALCFGMFLGFLAGSLL